jgi:hypothetical protein
MHPVDSSDLDVTDVEKRRKPGRPKKEQGVEAS